MHFMHSVPEEEMFRSMDASLVEPMWQSNFSFISCNGFSLLLYRLKSYTSLTRLDIMKDPFA